MRSNKSLPLVSVIIPSFNRDVQVCRAIQSVLDQTIDRFEIIVIDNSSSDDTISMVAKLHDSRIRCLTIQNGGVISRSRNLGIAISAGKYLAFLDSDDYWEKDKLEISIDALRKGADLVHHDMKLEWIVDRPPRADSILKGGKQKIPTHKNLLLSGNRVNLSTVVLRRGLLIDNAFREDRDFVGFEDYMLWIDLAKGGCRFNYISGYSGAVYTIGNNFSSNARELVLLKNFRKKYRRVFQEYFGSNSVAWISYRYGRIQFEAKKFALARKLFFLAIFAPGTASLKSKAVTYFVLSWFCFG